MTSLTDHLRITRTHNNVTGDEYVLALYYIFIADMEHQYPSIHLRYGIDVIHNKGEPPQDWFSSSDDLLHSQEYYRIIFVAETV